MITGRLTMLSEKGKQDIYDAAVRDHRARSACACRTPSRASCSSGAGATVETATSCKHPARRWSRRPATRSPAMIHVYDRNGEPAMEVGGTNTLLRHRLRPHEHLRPRDRRAPRPAVSPTWPARRTSATACPTSTSSCRAPTRTTSSPPTRAYLESFRAMVSNTTKPMVMTAAGGDDLEVMWKIACELRGGEEELRAKPYFIHVRRARQPPAARAARCSTSCSSAPTRAFPRSTRRRRSPAPRRRSPRPATSCWPSPSRCSASSSTSSASPGAPLHLRHGPGQDRHDHRAGALQLGRVLHDHPRHHARWPSGSTCRTGATPARATRTCVDAQAGMDISRAHAALHAGRLQPQPRHRLPRLRPDRRARARRHHRRDHLAEPPHARGHRGQPTRRSASTSSPRSVTGGDFLREKHTAKYVRGQQWMPTMLNRDTQKNWEADGSPGLREKARRKALDILANHTPAPLAPGREGHDGRAGRRLRRGGQVS